MLLLSLFFLIICSFTDLRERGISIVLLAAFLTSSILLTIGVCIYGERYGNLKGLLEYTPGLISVAAALIPGIILFFIGKLTKGAVGEGDAYMIFVLGFMMGPEKIIFLLFVSMVITAVFGIFYMISGRGGRHDALPYAPFLLASFILMTCIINFIKAGAV